MPISRKIKGILELLIRQESHLGKALIQGFKGDAPFQASQWCPNAEVDTVSEGQMVIGSSCLS